MSDFQTNLRRLMESENLNQVEFAKRIGKTPGAVSLWLKGERTPSLKTISEICEAFGLAEADLIEVTHRQAGTHVPRITEAKMIDYLKRPHDANGVLKGILMDEISLPAPILEKHPHGFYIKAEDNSMSKVYPAGCHLYVDPELEPSNGSIAVIREEGKFVCRRMFKATSTIVLSPESWEDGWEDIVLTRNKRPNEFFGTVVWFQASGELG